MPRKKPDPYETLGVSKDATPQTIKRAYRRKAKEKHPDRGGDREEFRQLLLAFHTLSDSAKRERFDSTGETSDAPDNRAAQVVCMAAQVFDAVLGDLLGKGQEPAEYDLAAVMRVVVENKATELKRQRQGPAKKAASLRKLLGRFAAKDGPNDMEEIIRVKLAAEEQAIRAADDSIALNDMLMAYVKRLRFNASPATDRKVMSGSVFTWTIRTS